jgi:hypothetical protein
MPLSYEAGRGVNGVAHGGMHKEIDLRLLAACLAALSMVSCQTSAHFSKGDLASIVLKPSEGLAGTALQEAGPEDLGTLSRYFAGLKRAGFVAAHHTTFGHEDVLSGDVEDGSLPGREARATQSLVVLFESAQGAADALHTAVASSAQPPFEVERTLSADGLGEEGAGVRVRSRMTAVTLTAFQWRRSNLFLFLLVTGEYDAADARRLADVMDTRAEAVQG